MKKDNDALNQLTIRPKLRLTEIERLLGDYRIILPVPSRATLVNMCEGGVFETVNGRPHPGYGWLVYEDSFIRWVRELDGDGGAN